MSNGAYQMVLPADSFYAVSSEFIKCYPNKAKNKAKFFSRVGYTK